MLIFEGDADCKKPYLKVLLDVFLFSRQRHGKDLRISGSYAAYGGDLLVCFLGLQGQAELHVPFVPVAVISPEKTGKHKAQAKTCGIREEQGFCKMPDILRKKHVCQGQF